MSTCRCRSQLIAVMITAAPLAAQQPQMVRMNPGELFAPKQVDIKGGRTEVPMQLLGGGRATVKATVNGRGPFVFAIETGAPFVMVTADRAAAMALTQAPMPPGMQMRTPDGSVLDVGQIDSLQIGGATLRNITVTQGPELLPGVDGLLGLAAYADLVMTVDYANLTFALEKGALPEPDGRAILPLTSIGAHIGVEVESQGQHLPAVIDTQGGTDISVSPEIAATLQFAAPPIVVGAAAIGGTAPVPVSAARLNGDLHLGQYTVQRPILNIVAPPPGLPRQVLLGIQFLRRFSVSIDQKNRRVRFNAPSTIIPPSPPLRTIGLALAPSASGGVTVADAISGGAAAGAGLHAGDDVVQIGGRPAQEFLGGNALVTLVQAGGVIRFVVMRDGKRQTIDVTPLERLR